MTTLQEFLDGRPLTYKGFKQKKCEATVVGKRVAVTDHKGNTTFAAVESDRDRRNLYHNLTRSR